MNWRRTLAVLLTAGLAVELSSLPAHSADRHVHGVSNLRVAVDGNALRLEFSSPLENLVGFEHAPRTDKQKAALRGMAEQLRGADVQFVPTPAARCNPVSVRLQSALLDEAPAGDKAGRAARKEQPAESGTSDEHADVSAEYLYRCEQPDALRDLRVNLFETFRRLRRIDVQVAGPHGQSAAKLSPAQRRISW
jgi:hypothetical protein